MQMSTVKARELLSREGWALIEHRAHPDSFGNECLVMAKPPILIRLLVDRGFSHVDLAGRRVMAEADWIPLEVAALAAGRIDRDAVEQNYRASCDFAGDTGEIKAKPLFENPLTEILDHDRAYADILTNGAELAKAQMALATITASVLDEVRPDLLDAD